MSRVNLNGVEIEYDFTDADNWDAIQAAVKDLEEYDRTHEYDPSDPGESIRHACKGYNQFFDDVFGEGMAERLFHGKNSMKEHKDTFVKVIELANGQMEEAVNFTDTINKYSPNRVQRTEDFQRKNRHHR